MSYTVPNTFATQSGNVPASQLDANFAALLAGVNNAYLIGLDGAKPAASTDGRYYYATDTGLLYRDNGAAWVQIAVNTIINTWTPTLGGSATYSLQNGIYVKLGRLVWIGAQLTVTALGTGSPNTI